MLFVVLFNVNIISTGSEIVVQKNLTLLNLDPVYGSKCWFLNISRCVPVAIDNKVLQVFVHLKACMRLVLQNKSQLPNRYWEGD